MKKAEEETSLLKQRVIARISKQKVAKESDNTKIFRSEVTDIIKLPEPENIEMPKKKEKEIQVAKKKEEESEWEQYKYQAKKVIVAKEPRVPVVKKLIDFATLKKKLPLEVQLPELETSSYQNYMKRPQREIQFEMRKIQKREPEQIQKPIIKKEKKKKEELSLSEQIARGQILSDLFQKKKEYQHVVVEVIIEEEQKELKQKIEEKKKNLQELEKIGEEIQKVPKVKKKVDPKIQIEKKNPKKEKIIQEKEIKAKILIIKEELEKLQNELQAKDIEKEEKIKEVNLLIEEVEDDAFKREGINKKIKKKVKENVHKAHILNKKNKVSIKELTFKQELFQKYGGEEEIKSLIPEEVEQEESKVEQIQQEEQQQKVKKQEKKAIAFIRAPTFKATFRQIQLQAPEQQLQKPEFQIQLQKPAQQIKQSFKQEQSGQEEEKKEEEKKEEEIPQDNGFNRRNQEEQEQIQMPAQQAHVFNQQFGYYFELNTAAALNAQIKNEIMNTFRGENQERFLKPEILEKIVPQSDYYDPEVDKILKKNLIPFVKCEIPMDVEDFDQREITRGYTAEQIQFLRDNYFQHGEELAINEINDIVFDEANLEEAVVQAAIQPIFTRSDIFTELEKFYVRVSEIIMGYHKFDQVIQGETGQSLAQAEIFQTTDFFKKVFEKLMAQPLNFARSLEVSLTGSAAEKRIKSNAIQSFLYELCTGSILDARDSFQIQQQLNTRNQVLRKQYTELLPLNYPNVKGFLEIMQDDVSMEWVITRLGSSKIFLIRVWILIKEIAVRLLRHPLTAHCDLVNGIFKFFIPHKNYNISVFPESESNVRPAFHAIVLHLSAVCNLLTKRIRHEALEAGNNTTDLYNLFYNAEQRVAALQLSFREMFNIDENLVQGVLQPDNQTVVQLEPEIGTLLHPDLQQSLLHAKYDGGELIIDPRYHELVLRQNFLTRRNRDDFNYALTEHIFNQMEELYGNRNVTVFVSMLTSVWYKADAQKYEKEYLQLGFGIDFQQIPNLQGAHDKRQIVSQMIERKIADAWNEYEALDVYYSTMSIESYRMVAVNNQRLDAVQQHKILQFDANKRIFTGNRDAVMQEEIYKKSVAEDYFDMPEFNCVANIAAYLQSVLEKKQFTVDYIVNFMESEVWNEIEPFILKNNVAQVFNYYREKMRLILFFVENNIFYHSDQTAIDIPIILIWKNHAWIGRHAWLLNRIQKVSLDPAQKKKFQIFRIKSLQRAHNFKKKRGACKQKNNLCFFDIETMNDEGNLIPVLLCADFKIRTEKKGRRSKVRSFQKSWLSMNCLHEFVIFLDELMEKYQIKIYVYGHNSNRFDTVLLEKILLDKYGANVDLKGTFSNIKFLQVQGKLGSLVFRDMCQLLPGRLEDLAKSYQTEHKKMDFDHTKTTLLWLAKEENRKEIIKYCINDVVVLKELYYKFLELMQKIIPTFQENDIKQSTASTAFNLFQRYFNNFKNIFGNTGVGNGLNIQAIERNSYFGGMTQVFKHRADKRLKYYDFVSMYPTVMRENKFQISQGIYKKQKINFTPERDAQFIDTDLYIVEAFCFKENCLITNFPVRDQKTNVSIYPQQFYKGDGGNKYLSMWGVEINLAKKFGILASLSITGKIVYVQTDFIFGNYIDKFFGLKEKSEGPVRELAKLMLNSLYGKLGQRLFPLIKYFNKGDYEMLGVEDWEDMFQNQARKDAERELKEKVGVEFDTRILQHIQVIDDSTLQVTLRSDLQALNYCGSMIRIASYVTALARSRLVKLIYEVGPEHCYYCDTDSLVFDAECEGKIVSFQKGKQLGNIDDQFGGVEIETAEFVAAKCYYFKLKDLYKGKKEYVRFKGVQKPTIEMIKELHEKGENKVPHETWRRTFGHVNISNKPKEIALKTKRLVNADGTTIPFRDYDNFNEYKDSNLFIKNNVFIYMNDY